MFKILWVYLKLVDFTGYTTILRLNQNNKESLAFFFFIKIEIKTFSKIK